MPVMSFNPGRSGTARQAMMEAKRAERRSTVGYINPPALACHEKTSVRQQPSGFVLAIHASCLKRSARSGSLPAERNKKYRPELRLVIGGWKVMDTREERIKRRAYEIWEREGRPTGREQEHWDQAVQEIEGEGSRPEHAPDPTVSAGSKSSKD
jgi:hypothetical protein